MLKDFFCVSAHLAQYDEIIFAITAVCLEIGYWILTHWKSSKRKCIEIAVKLSNKSNIYLGNWTLNVHGRWFVWILETCAT